MAIPGWNRIFINTLATVSLFGSFTILKINKHRVAAADGSDFPVPERGIPWNRNWDGREPPPRPIECECNGSGDCARVATARETPSKAIRNIFLIRHGEYRQTGGQLTLRGYDQALKTAARLQQLGYPYNPIIITSKLIRAVETSLKIKQLHQNLSIRQFGDLNEGVPIRPEPVVRQDTTSDEVIAEDGPVIEGAFREFFYRANPQQERDSYQLIVCHSNVIRYFVCRALQFPPEAWNRFSLFHCSITWIVIYPNGRVELRALGDAEHMPYKLLTF